MKKVSVYFFPEDVALYEVQHNKVPWKKIPWRERFKYLVGKWGYHIFPFMAILMGLVFALGGSIKFNAFCSGMTWGALFTGWAAGEYFRGQIDRWVGATSKMMDTADYWMTKSNTWEEKYNDLKKQLSGFNVDSWDE